MPALCLMLTGTYYAKNYAGIIGRGLIVGRASLGITIANRAVACDVTSAAFNQNVWQKRVVFVQRKARFQLFCCCRKSNSQTTMAQ